MDLNNEQWLQDRLTARLAPLEARLTKLEGSSTPVVPPEAPLPAPSPPAGAAALDLSKPAVGMNLGFLNYYTGSFPWPNLLRYSHTQGGDGAWMGTAGLEHDQDGYPLSVVPPQYAGTLVATVGGNYPGGNYALSWLGKGSVRLAGDAQGTYSVSPVTVAVTPSPSGIDVRIVSSLKGDHLRDLKLELPGSGVHNGQWIARHTGYRVFRFMDWGRTNGSPHVAWPDRKLPTERSVHGDRGVSYEDMIRLCNTMLVHPWVCVPHKADMDYVRRMAELFLALDPRLTPVLEYSNECWNGGFSQTGWLEALSGAENVRQTYARKAVESFALWKGVWGPRKFLRVLCGQSANPDVGKQILTAAGPGNFDAYGIAPYFGGKADLTQSVTAVLGACLQDVELQKAKMVANKAVADFFNVPLVAYEGGQHVMPNGDGQVARLREVQTDPRMGEVYETYLGHWKATGGGLFCHFNDIHPTSRSGAWGLYDFDLSPETVKSNAVRATARAWGG